MFVPKSIYTDLAFRSIAEYLTQGNTYVIEQESIAPPLLQQKSCFVSIHLAQNCDLRGCIGTITPVYDSLFFEIIHNAVSAATRDPRFSSLTLRELQKIQLSVDVLSIPIKVENLLGHNPKTHGLIISDSKGRKGVLLPDLEGIDTAKQQEEIVKKKAGIYWGETNLNYFTFTVERFH